MRFPAIGGVDAAESEPSSTGARRGRGDPLVEAHARRRACASTRGSPRPRRAPVEEGSLSAASTPPIAGNRTFFCTCRDLEPEGSVHGERANFGGLVLGCIDSYDSESRRIFSDFSRSTRFSPLRTALNPKFQEKLAKKFSYFCRNFAKFC